MIIKRIPAHARPSEQIITYRLGVLLIFDNNAAEVYLGLRSASSCQNCIFLDWKWAKSQRFSSAVNDLNE